MELPVARGLFLCERIVVEEGTRYVTLVSIFDERTIADFPTDPIACAIYASLVSGRGIIPMTLRVSRLDDMAEIYEKSFSLEFVDPMIEIRFMFQFQGLVFPTAGRYEYLLLADASPVASTVLNLFAEEE